MRRWRSPSSTRRSSAVSRGVPSSPSARRSTSSRRSGSATGFAPCSTHSSAAADEELEVALAYGDEPLSGPVLLEGCTGAALQRGHVRLVDLGERHSVQVVLGRGSRRLGDCTMLNLFL